MPDPLAAWNAQTAAARDAYRADEAVRAGLCGTCASARVYDNKRTCQTCRKARKAREASKDA